MNISKIYKKQGNSEKSEVEFYHLSNNFRPLHALKQINS